MPDPVQTLQVSFLLAASTIVSVNFIPAIRQLFINYGPRTASHVTSQQDSKTRVPGLLDKLAALQVPHAYFNHFYVVSVASSLFWAIQFLTKGALLHRICQAVQETNNASMSSEQIELTWALMSAQGLRRQFETVTLAKPSSSQMWFLHYLVGLAFYLAMGVAVWIEGAGTLTKSLETGPSITYSAPSLRTMLALPVFILASGVQNDCHGYLASLKKYTLPIHPIFNLLVCPHYTAECLIYLSLAFLSAPHGAWINKTMFTAFLFVSANLSVTAAGTKAWYEKKFGEDAVKNRWTMIPSVW